MYYLSKVCIRANVLFILWMLWLCYIISLVEKFLNLNISNAWCIVFVFLVVTILHSIQFFFQIQVSTSAGGQLLPLQPCRRQVPLHNCWGWHSVCLIPEPHIWGEGAALNFYVIWWACQRRLSIGILIEENYLIQLICSWRFLHELLILFIRENE
jgi:hypothetical protein